MAEPIGQKLVILAADYVPEALSVSDKLVYNLVVQAYKNNDITGAALGGSDVEPREIPTQKGIILLPSQNEPFEKTNLKTLYLSGKTGDRFLLRWNNGQA